MAIFSYYIIKIMPSDTESLEDQDSSKKMVVQETITELLAAIVC